MLHEGNDAEGTRHLEHAVQLDPLLEQAVELLRRQYLAQGEAQRATEVLNGYRAAMGFSRKFEN